MIDELSDITQNTHRICEPGSRRHHNNMDGESHHTATTTATTFRTTSLFDAVVGSFPVKQSKDSDLLTSKGCTCSGGGVTAMEAKPGSSLSDLKLPINMDLITKAQGADEDRREKRREQNKAAAARYRNRKRTSKEALTEEIEEMRNTNSTLRAKLRRMEDRREYLVQAIRTVRTTCFSCDSKCVDIAKDYSHMDSLRNNSHEQHEPLCLAITTEVH